MNLCRRIYVFTTIILSALFFINPVASYADNHTPGTITEEMINQLDRYIEKQIENNEIPGLSVSIIIDGKAAYRKGFGYSRLSSEEKVTEHTLFELGSNSKSFTALAIIKLREQGLIDLNAPVSDYLPWFHPTFEGNITDIKVEQLLHHTSGMAFTTIGDFMPSTESGALEDAIRGWSNSKLSFLPGTGYEYATANYSILGLIIQNVSKKSYEQFIREEVLIPLGLTHTYVGKENEPLPSMSEGYKLGFQKMRQYDAPTFRANTPGGYVISNGEDMVRWMEFQLGVIRSDIIPLEWIQETQQNSSTSAPFYALGWTKEDAGRIISHGGSNPSFSSYVVLRPEEQVGIAIMANVNSEYTPVIAYGIDQILNAIEPIYEPVESDPLLAAVKQLDIISYAATASILVFCLLIVILIVLLIRQVRAKKREARSNSNKLKVIGYNLILSIVMGMGLTYAYQTFKVMDLPMSFVIVWGPISFPIALLTVVAACFLMILYLTMTFLYPKVEEKHWFLLICLSVLSGFGNAAIIFCIIQAINRDDMTFNKNLMIYFLISIGIYIVCQRLSRNMLIRITNQVVYEKRLTITHAILDSSYEKLERLGKGKIQTVLNNDTGVIGSVAGIFVGLTVNIVTLIFCFIYLGIVSLSGLLLSVVAIFIASGAYYFIGKQAQMFMERNRSVQDGFFRFIGDLIGGIKELQLNKRKREDFTDDMAANVSELRDTNVAGQSKFTNVVILGELLFVLVIGIVVFVFPLIFKGIESANVMDYVFVFLYMTGPVNGVLNSIPAIINFRVSWNRMNQTIQEITELAEGDTDSSGLVVHGNNFTIRFDEILFRYFGDGDQPFTLGPLSFECNTGEVIFITGGNGSGKSTFAKLLTGLYTPESGTITINGKVVQPTHLRQLYSTIYSDYYLFEKLYGLEEESYRVTIQEWLHELKLEDKVTIDNGKFSTVNLSTGQRKRLALMISRLEKRPILLFDEWAADQDPEYRRFFYESLLPEMKRKGCCVIAITHDDRYFHLADKVIKMEMGKIIELIDDAEYDSEVAG